MDPVIQRAQEQMRKTLGDSDESKLSEIKGFLKLAKKALNDGQLELADKFLESLVAVQLPDEQKKVALREVAEMLEAKDEKVKAIAIYEKLYHSMENDSEAPLWLVKMGELYRDCGAYKQAVDRFYSVMNAAIKVGGRDFESHQGLARRAQREIADTFFLKGDFEQAQKYYNQSLRSELSRDDRATVLFRAAHCTFMRNDMHAAIAIFERFLKENGQHASAAEARYMLAAAYRAQGRPQEAYDTVIELLRAAKAKKDTDPKRWALWYKKAGNEFANDFYQSGDFVRAVTIYQSLATISEDPEWHWPVAYQMGLCFERLRQERRATETYKYIVEQSEKPEVQAKRLSESLLNLVEMAKWRLEQLDWQSNTEQAIRKLAGPEIKDLPKLR